MKINWILQYLIKKVCRVQICKYFLRLYPFSNLNTIKTDGSMLRGTTSFIAGPKFQKWFFKKTDPYINTLPTFFKLISNLEFFNFYLPIQNFLICSKFLKMFDDLFFSNTAYCKTVSRRVRTAQTWQKRSRHERDPCEYISLFGPSKKYRNNNEAAAQRSIFCRFFWQITKGFAIHIWMVNWSIWWYFSRVNFSSNFLVSSRQFFNAVVMGRSFMN